MTKTFVSTHYFVPEGWVPSSVRAIELTIKPIQWHEEEEPKQPIILYDTTSHPGMIGLPIDWGIRTYGQRRGVEIEDRTEHGGPLNAPSRPDPNHPNVLDPVAQRQFMDNMLEAAEEDYAVMALADTGTGKTPVGLYTAAELGRTTLVVCHLERIAKQWMRGAELFLGLRKDQIGFVRGDKCPYDRPFCVTLVQSLTRREYDPDFYNAFGTVIWDEVHKYGTAGYARSLVMFPAKHKIALTATEKRKDGTHEVYLKQFGRGQVVSEAEALPCTVHVLEYTSKGTIWGEDAQTLKLCVSKDPVRNQLLARIIRMLYKDHNRQVLAIGDSIEHIETLVSILLEQGVPRNEIGQHTREHTNAAGEREATTDEYLDWCRDVPSIVFGTDRMLKEGVDIPRLDAGVELVPWSDATQMLGRVRRPLEGKTDALWYTIIDKRIGMFIGLYKSRAKDYLNDPNIEVVTKNGKT